MLRRCTRCLYEETTPGISFDAQGVCSYCQKHDELEQAYPTGEVGLTRLKRIADEIREAGQGKKYDVVVGVSGGCDSSYMLYLAKQLRLRPLAVHFDNTWDSTVAVENIQQVLKTLDVDLYTYVVDNKEYDDIYRSFMLAGVVDVDTPTDIGLATVLYMAATQYGVKYIFEGHSFRTEGLAPLGWFYIDGKYVASVQKKFGRYPLKTFPNLWMHKFLWWVAVKRIRKIRPLYYVNYAKKDAMQLLTSELGWKWYGGHHLENRFTAFCHSYFLPKRWNIDSRLLGYTALVRSGQMTREQGLKLLQEPQPYDEKIVEMVKTRLGFTDEEFEQVMAQPKRTYREFETYKPTFERLRWFFWLLSRFELVPRSFYIKYTSKSDI